MIRKARGILAMLVFAVLSARTMYVYSVFGVAEPPEEAIARILLFMLLALFVGWVFGSLAVSLVSESIQDANTDDLTDVIQGDNARGEK